jgi:hypothetical protein
MKTGMKIMLALLAAGATTFVAQAQDDGTNAPPQGDHGFGGHHHHPPPLPLAQALDVNHDGVIDASEITNASAELLTLDKNSDGKLTVDEYMPPAPTNAPADFHPPTPLIVKALDVNGDGVIDASEIASASAVLQKLDKNGDGQLTRDEYLGKRPGRPPQAQRDREDWNGDNHPHHPPQDGNGGDGDNDGPQGPPPDDAPPMQ